MDPVACTAGLDLSPSTLLTLGAVALATFVWAAQRIVQRRQARHAASAQAAARLVGYQLAARLRQRQDPPFSLEWAIAPERAMLHSTGLLAGVTVEDRGAGPSGSRGGAVRPELVA